MKADNLKKVRKLPDGWLEYVVDCDECKALAPLPLFRKGVLGSVFFVFYPFFYSQDSELLKRYISQEILGISILMCFPFCAPLDKPKISKPHSRTCLPKFQELVDHYVPEAIVTVGSDCFSHLCCEGSSPPDMRLLAGTFVYPDQFALQSGRVPVGVVRSPTKLISEGHPLEEVLGIFRSQIGHMNAWFERENIPTELRERRIVAEPNDSKENQEETRTASKRERDSSFLYRRSSSKDKEKGAHNQVVDSRRNSSSSGPRFR